MQTLTTGANNSLKPDQVVAEKKKTQSLGKKLRDSQILTVVQTLSEKSNDVISETPGKKDVQY